MAQVEIEIAIETLTLAGLPAPDLVQLSTALHGELTRLLQNNSGLSDQWLSAEVGVPTVTIPATAGASPAWVGVQVAQAIFANLTTSPGSSLTGG